MSDERVKKPAGEDKSNRAMSDRAFTENRELSEAERLEQLLSGYQQSHLPDLPPIPGYHTVWLTTINPRDSIPMRQRMGYQLIKAEELGPGWESVTVKSGEHPGCVMVNEMIAAKIPDDLYQVLMRYYHQKRPLEEESRMNAAADLIKAEADKRGLRVVEGEAAERWT